MTYDQAEAVHARIADQFPQQDCAIVLKPRTDTLELRDYAVQTTASAGSITSDVVAKYAAIAEEVVAENYPNPPTVTIVAGGTIVFG